MDKLTGNSNIKTDKPSKRCKKSTRLSKEQKLIDELVEYNGVSNMRRLMKKYEKTQDEIVEICKYIGIY